MSIEFRCTHCDKKLKVKDELEGKKIKCPGCGQGTVVSAEQPDSKPVKKPSKTNTGNQPAINPDLNSTESLLNLDFRKFKNKAIDPFDSDINIDEFEGAIVRRKKQEELAEVKEPPVPLQPIDWLMGLLCFPIGLVFSIVLITQGKKSRGTKSLILSLIMLVFWGIVGTLFGLALGVAVLKTAG